MVLINLIPNWHDSFVSFIPPKQDLPEKFFECNAKSLSSYYDLSWL